MNSLLISYLKNIQEGYLVSDKTISVNLEDFERGSKNLLIVGVCGSGKTTLAKYLSEKYKVSNVIYDDSSKKMIEGMESSQRTIIEGAQIATLYKEKPEYRKLILNQPMILIGMSAIKAGLKADKRDGTVLGTAKNWRELYYFVRNNLTYFQESLNYLRKDVMKIPNSKIKEYKIPALN